MDVIVSFLKDPMVGGVILTLVGLMLADLLTAIGAAFRRKGTGLLGSEFEPLVVAEFLRSHVLGRLLPIIFLVFLAKFSEPLVAVVALAVAAYTVETIASVKANLELASDA